MDSGGTTNYAFDGADPASPMLADTNATYTPGLSERRGSTSKFYHSDALGSTRGITNASQSATDSQLFDAWGMVVSRTGSTPTPFGFAGTSQYQTDPDSGLQLLGHRYYDPSTGRFITQDPIQDGENWYQYCGNGPLGGVDPTGELFWLVVAAVVYFIVVSEKPADPPPPGYVNRTPYDDVSSWINEISDGPKNYVGAGPGFELPPNVIVRDKGVTIRHHHGGGREHGPPHAHVEGGGPTTKIGRM